MIFRQAENVFGNTDLVMIYHKVRKCTQLKPTQEFASLFEFFVFQV